MLGILKNHSILYIEDEPQIQKNITEYLKSYFGKVYVASNGEEGLDLYKLHYPDVLLLDINLPCINGLDLAKEVRQKDQSIKIIMLTAHTEKEKLLLATELKLTKYLIKPITPKVFKETMELLAKELQHNPSRFLDLSEGFVWDKINKTLSHHDHQTELSHKEHSLLMLLISHKGHSVSYEEIIVNVWEDAFEKNISLDSIKNLVSHLRKKLPQGSIQSIYGKGYSLK